MLNVKFYGTFNLYTDFLFSREGAHYRYLQSSYSGNKTEYKTVTVMVNNVLSTFNLSVYHKTFIYVTSPFMD